MPTQYTTLLGLAKPQTGELSGTWGATVNDYLTEYLDAAVAGAQTISGSQTAVTLSKTEGSSLVQAGAGAAGSSQYSLIRCTGNPASTLTITVPATSKVYLVVNATSTSQDVKVVGVGPTTGITVAAAQAALIAWSGTDFVLIATTDVAKLSGVLPVANGGTGATTLTGVLKGNGTSAVTASNVNLASEVTGTLPVANGGTGATSLTGVLKGNGASAFTASNVNLASEVTGTLPVANGGTGAASFSSGQFLKGAGTSAFTTAATVALGAEVSGTLPVANGGTGINSFGTGVATALGQSVTGSGGMVLATSPTIQTSLSVDGSVTINDSGSSSANLRVEGDTDVNLLFTNASTDRVGIGTNAPSTKLHVATTTGAAVLTFTNGTTTTFVGANALNQSYFGSNSNHPTRLIQNGIAQLEITTAGLVAIDNGYGSLATFYGCRAWVNFNGTGTPALRGNGNVSSITDNGTGDYTINFTNFMPDTNYSVQAIIDKSGNGQATDAANIVTPLTGSVRVQCWWSNFSSGGQFDPTIVCVSVFR